jgi:hypothetical protein
MWEKIKQIWSSWSTEGMKLPFVHDGATGKPSVTLLFTYIAFTLSVISVIVLHLKLDLVVATITTIIFWVLSVVFYLIRNLQKAKFDLDDKSIELEGEDEETK